MQKSHACKNCEMEHSPKQCCVFGKLRFNCGSVSTFQDADKSEYAKSQMNTVEGACAHGFNFAVAKAKDWWKGLDPITVGRWDICPISAGHLLTLTTLYLQRSVKGLLLEEKLPVVEQPYSEYYVVLTASRNLFSGHKIYQRIFLGCVWRCQ